MLVSALKPDEIEVECEVRGILTGSDDALSTLQQQMEDEKAGSCNLPQRMHSKASRNPNGEIESCRTKLVGLKNDISQLKSVPTSEQVDKAHQIWSRLKHIQGRLERVSFSPTYQEAARRLLRSCEKLFEPLDGFLKNSDDLNNSIKTAEEVEIEPVTPVIADGNTMISQDKTTVIPTPGTYPHPTSVATTSETHTLKSDLIGLIQENTMAPTPLMPSISDVNSEDQRSLVTQMMTQIEQLTERVKLLSQIRDDSQRPVTSNPISVSNPVVGPPVVSIPMENFHHARFQDPIPTISQNYIPPIFSMATINASSQSAVSTSRSNPPAWSSPVASQHNSAFSRPDLNPQPHLPGENFSLSSYHTSMYRRQLSRSGISYNGSTSGITVELFFFFSSKRSLPQ